MKEWLTSLSAAAVVLLLLEYLLSESAIQKTVKFALSLLFMLLILSPMIGLLRQPIDLKAISEVQTAKPANTQTADYADILKAAQEKGDAYGVFQPQS